MTAIEEWATKVAVALAKEPEHAEDCPVRVSTGCEQCKEEGEVAAFDPHVAAPCPKCRPGDQHEGWERCRCGYVPSTLEQRIAIGLMEARAVECRYWSTKLLSKFLGEVWAVWLSKHLDDRERKLGLVGLAMAKKWPPNTPAATLVETGGLGDLQ